MFPSHKLVPGDQNYQHRALLDNQSWPLAHCRETQAG